MQDEREQTRKAKRQKRRAQKHVLRNWQSLCGNAEWSREDEVTLQLPLSHCASLLICFGAVIAFVRRYKHHGPSCMGGKIAPILLQCSDVKVLHAGSGWMIRWLTEMLTV